MVYVICFVLLVYFGWFVFAAPKLIQRIGSGLAIASILLLGNQAYHWRGRQIREWKRVLRLSPASIALNLRDNVTSTVASASGSHGDRPNLLLCLGHTGRAV
jgi:hypothetical protein